MKMEKVNHPLHYKGQAIETIDKIQLVLTEEEYRGFLKGNIMKYGDRMGLKENRKEDYEKQQWYLERYKKGSENSGRLQK